MATGTVKWFKDRPQKGGYGFIKPDDNTRDVFFTFNSIAKKAEELPLEGRKVEYTLQPTVKGLIAQEMKVL